MSFSNDFLWGAASAAYQVEGAYNEDGKGMGIWDVLYPGHVHFNENGNTACDHYHRYKEDIALMKKLGLKSYRFSISWPRLMPEEGIINQKAVAYYQDLVHELRCAGIEPLCTLFHWNLPMWIHEKGGWAFDGISDLFASYAKAVIDILSDQVSYWMTFNEPACFIGLGYIDGIHAPFECHKNDPYYMKHTLPLLCKNVLLSHGKAVTCIRKHAKLPPKIGMALNCHFIEPWNDTPEAISSAKEKTFSFTHPFSLDLWAGPMINGTLQDSLKPVISEKELELIHQPLDFFGLNCYNANNEYENPSENPDYACGLPRTTMGWPITPNVLYWAASFIYERYHLPLLITENGMANTDFIMADGKVHDPQRIDYLSGYLHGLKKAIEEGIPVIGYQYWSIMDNFEWERGYSQRFGLIYVDYKTQKRTLKDSAYWYRSVIAENGEYL